MKLPHNFFLMIHSHRFFINTIFFSFLLQACNTFNQEEPIPSYIHIEKINLKTDYSKQGSNSSKISDAWVYIDEKLIGCFELPATFPVLEEGTHLLKIRAGIKVNGIAASRGPYPFYQPYIQQVDFQKNKRLTINPVVSYASSTHFNFMENFDGAGIILAPNPNEPTDDTIKQTFTKNNVFEGSGSGIVRLTKNKLRFHNVSNTSYVLPKNGSPVFLEFNYKCNSDFYVGIYAHTNISGGTNTLQTIALGLNASNNWNKIYAYLTPAVSKSGNATDYNVFFTMVKNTPGDSIGLLIDNIKLVY